MTSVALEVQNLSKDFDDYGQTVKVLKDISLKVNTGEFVSITGPSGSGKSTLLYLLGLLDSPSTGKVIINNQDSTLLTQNQKSKFRLENLGYIFQFHFLIAEFTAKMNVMLPMLRLGQVTQDEAEVKAKKLLDLLDLSDKYEHKPHQLSGGQRQRVAIARSLANDPKFILADEPTGSLDSKNAKNVVEIFKTLNQELKQTILVVTHDENISKQTTREIRIMDGVVSG